MKPIIGIPGNVLTQQSASYEGLPLTYTPQGFIDGITAGFGLPMVIPMGKPENAKQYISHIDGLLLAGGQDVSPLLYGEEPIPALTATSPVRDTFEIALIQEAIAQKKPILAVCRGIQIANVAFGGSLYQDLTHSYPDLAVQHVQQTMYDSGAHTIDLDPESRLAAIYGKSYVVNSYHHQAIKELAEPFKAVAWSKDNLIEGIEAKDPALSFVGVQWHPELMVHSDKKMQQLFTEFVSRVKKGISPAL